MRCCNSCLDNCGGCTERALSPVEWLANWLANVYERVDSKILRMSCFKPDVYKKVTLVLCILSFLLIPLNIAVNFTLSYRLDLARFFDEHSDYAYHLAIEGALAGSFWTHKISTMVWNAAVITHILLLTLLGYKERFHEIFGAVTVASAFTAAVAGCVLMSFHDARYDQFTDGFFVLLLIVVFSSILIIVVDRVFVRRYIVRKKPEHRWLHARLHAFFGFLLLLPPLAMMIQFITYSLLIVIGNGNHDDYDYWKGAMYFSIVAGISTTIGFSINAALRRDLRNTQLLASAAEASEPIASAAGTQGGSGESPA